MLREFIRKLIEVRGNDLSFLNVGDIIWAKRYKTEEEKNKIKKGHQESPYVIIKKENGKVYALECTSNPHEEVEWKMAYYPIGRFNYNMSKNTYINCTKTYRLQEIQFVEIIGHLKENDLNSVKKQLYILLNSRYKIKPYIEKKYLDYKISVGDVIEQNDIRYYIHSLNKRYLYCYPLKKVINKHNSILINNTYYNFDFTHEEKIKIKSQYDLVDTFNSGEIVIINKFKEKLEQNKESKSLRIGALIDYNAKMYYVYDEKEDYLYAYQVYSNDALMYNTTSIQVKKGFYKTYFSQVVLRKDKVIENSKIRRCASREEILKNAKLLSMPKKMRIEESKGMTKKAQLTGQRSIEDFVPMTILKNENNQKYYLVINREGNVIEVVNINEMNDTYSFLLEEGNCPFKYYRILSKEEFDIYINKINELKEMAKKFFG